MTENMERQQAIDQIKETCNLLSKDMMKIQPLIRHLQDKETEAKMFETVFNLTTNIESIKKLAIKLQGKDSSTLL